MLHHITQHALFLIFFVISNYLAYRNIVVYVSLSYLRSHHQRPLDRPRSCLRPHPLSPPGNVYRGALAPDLSAMKRGKQYCKWLFWTTTLLNELKEAEDDFIMILWYKIENKIIGMIVNNWKRIEFQKRNVDIFNLSQHSRFYDNWWNRSAQ